MIRVQDLPQQIGASGPRALLLCPDCQNEYSAHQGDYFMASPDTVMRCSHCDTPLELVTKHTVYKAVKQVRARKAQRAAQTAP